MDTWFKLTANFKLIIGVQLIALGIAAVNPMLLASQSYLYISSATSLVTDITSNLGREISLNPQSSQGYQPPNTIGSPTRSIGSGTR